MTDFVAGQIGQQAQDVTGTPTDPDALAHAAHAAAGLGVTEADLDAIREQLARFKAQLDAQAAAQRAATPDDVSSSVAALQVQADNHGDPAVIALAADAAKAAESAVESGDFGPLSVIVSRITRQLNRNPAGPGDQFHFSQLRDTAAVHLPDVIDAASPQSADVVPAGKVVAGSVVG